MRIIVKIIDVINKLWINIKYIFMFKWLISKKTDWSKIQNNIDIGDVGLIDSIDLYSDSIEWFESMTGDKSRVSHCFIVTSKEGEIVEALADGVKKQNIRKYFNEENRIVIRRFKTPLSPSEKMKIQETAYKMVGQEYDYKQFIGLAIMYLLCLIFGRNKGLQIADRFRVYRGKENQVQCSTLVAACYCAVDRTVAPNIDIDRVTPKTMYESKFLYTVQDIKGSKN